MKKRWSTSFFALVMAVSTGGPLLAQGIQFGNLVGTVTLADGHPAPGVAVSATSPALQGERSTLTEASGDYVLRGLPPGEYTVRFALEGVRAEEAQITILLGGTARQDAALEAEAVSESIVVTGEAASSNETPTVGDNLQDDTVDALATSRDLIEIAKLAAGVTGNTPVTGQLTISGGLPYDNLLMIDGNDISDNVFGTADRLYIEDAIAETQVLTGAISAEYGRFGGGVVNAITKSGGNEFKGALRADVTNLSWREKTPLEREQGVRLSHRTNDVDTATLGGYILKDKLWFFVAGRHFADDQQSTLNLTGIPFVSTQDERRLQGKLTANLSDSHSLEGNYMQNERHQVRPNLLSAVTLDTVLDNRFPDDIWALRYTGVLGRSAFVEAHYSEKEFGFENSGGSNHDLRESPFLCVTLSCQYNGPYFDATDPETRANRQLSGSASYFLDTARLGSHDLKLGGERFTNIRTGGNSQSATDYTFSTDLLTDAEGNPVLDADGRAIPVFTPGFDFLTYNVFWAASRGARFELTTDSYYVSDDWKLNRHWSFNLGARYERITDQNTDRVKVADADSLSPRVAVSFDPKGNGKVRFDASYGQYAGSYNLALWTAPTAVNNPGYIFSVYLGPPGQGRDFDPGFDLDNYLPISAASPFLNVFFAPGTHSPLTDEYTLSAGLQLARGGYLRLTFQDRKGHDLIEDFVRFGQGTVDIEVGGIVTTVDRRVYDNTDLDKRLYRALLLQGKYRLQPRFTVEGSWTRQLRNEGNYEGQTASAITPGLVGDFPELFDERNFPDGRLPGYQEDVVHLWAIYGFDLGKAGDLSLSLLGNYFSPLTGSLTANNVPLTARQRALDPGYAQPPFGQILYFGERGSQEFNAWHELDFAARYGLPFWKRFEPWVKAEVRNLLNEDTLIRWNTAIVPITRNPDGSLAPVDALGRPATFRRSPLFGQARGSFDYQSPRSYLLSAGIRF